MRIYIAGPYTANHPRKILANVNKAIDIGIEVMKRGHIVYIPHLFHFMHLRPKCPFEYKEYMRNGMEWLKVSDAILVLNNSPGTDKEVRYAEKLGLKIYKSLDEVPEINDDGISNNRT